MCDSAHAGYQRLDQGTLNDPGKDSLSKEIQRCLHDPLAYDLVNMLTPREDRRLCGRVCVTLEDVMRGSAFADTLCHTFSTYDPHGRSFHPSGRLGLLPAQDAPRYAPVPLRALLPREIDNMLVCGKALSMDQDALNYARMAPDVMCVGYLAGRVAGMCVKQQCAAQARTLFEYLLQRQEADYASRADADVYARMRCAASLESLLDVYLERLEALAVNQSGYGYLVDEAIRCMEERLHESSLSLQEVSDYVHLSPGYLSKKLKESTGLSFQELLIKMRMERAAALLRDGHMLVYEAAERLGYQSYRSFSAAFEKYYRCNPKKFKG